MKLFFVGLIAFSSLAMADDLTAGQALVICGSDFDVEHATYALNSKINNLPDQVSQVIASGSGVKVYTAKAPFEISLPTISKDGKNIAVCVTVTKK